VPTPSPPPTPTSDRGANSDHNSNRITFKRRGRDFRSLLTGLVSLQVSPTTNGGIQFERSNLNYTAYVSANASSITVTALGLLPSAVVKVDGMAAAAGGTVAVPFETVNSTEITVTVVDHQAAIADVAVTYTIHCLRTKPPAVSVVGTGFQIAVLKNGVNAWENRGSFPLS
jgi:hypothetical protein